MTVADRTAQDTILAWCRSRPVGEGQPVMRQHAGRCLVIDVSRTDPKPGSTWERIPRVLAEGVDWDAVLEQLRTSGRKL